MTKIYTNTIAPGVNWGLKARNYDVIHYRETGVERVYYFTHTSSNGTKYFTSPMISSTDVIIYEIGIATDGVVNNTQVNIAISTE